MSKVIFEYGIVAVIVVVLAILLISLFCVVMSLATSTMIIISQGSAACVSLCENDANALKQSLDIIYSLHRADKNFNTFTISPNDKESLQVLIDKYSLICVSSFINSVTEYTSCKRELVVSRTLHEQRTTDAARLQVHHDVELASIHEQHKRNIREKVVVPGMLVN